MPGASLAKRIISPAKKVISLMSVIAMVKVCADEGGSNSEVTLRE